MNTMFLSWLKGKYGWGEKEYKEIQDGDPAFAEDLTLEYYGRYFRDDVKYRNKQRKNELKSVL